MALVFCVGAAVADESDLQLELRRVALKNAHASTVIGGQHPITLIATRVSMIDGTSCGWVRVQTRTENRLYLTCPLGTSSDRLQK